MDGERQEDIVFQIGQSKTQRNAITRAMPGWLVEKAIETAKQAVLSGISPETIHLARLKVIDFFSKYGVSQAQIETERGRVIDHWTPRDIVDLRGMATALKEGRVSAAEIFPAREPAPATGEPPAPSAEAAASEATSVDPGKAPPVAKSGKNGPQAAQSDPLPNQALPAGEEPLKELTKPCPNWEGKPKPVAFCNNLCTHREGCPEWD
jgi:hypothetical protein